MTTEIPDALRRPIATLEDAKAWVAALVEHELDFHLEEDPSELIYSSTGKPVFAEADLPLLRARVSELYRFDWGADECPYGYMVALLEETAGEPFFVPD